MPNEVNGEIKSSRAMDQREVGSEIPEVEEIQEPGWREAFRIALQQARRQRKSTAGRQELGRDKTKSLAMLVGGSIILLVLFFSLFSTSRKPSALGGENHKGQPNLGRKTTPGQENNDAGKTVVPMMSANIRSTDSAEDGQLTAEDVGRTAHAGVTATAPPPNFKDQEKYAIGRVDFSDPYAGAGMTPPFPSPRSSPQVASSVHDAPDLKKPSLVFVRSTEAKPTAQVPTPEDEDEPMALPAGTRLIALLQAPVTSATATPAVAIVEYNYERSGQIVVPAGAKVFGRLARVNASGYVELEFNRVELPDGRVQKIDATALNLELGPLKGSVSGKKKGTRFLVRSLTGIGTMASYLVGPQGSSAAGVLSSNTLMRERLSDNIGTAGQEQLNSLAFTQNLVVTFPGNTLFYIVLQKPTSETGHIPMGRPNSATNTSGLTGGVPTLEELRQLLELRREINELYTQSGSPPANQPPK